jgi:hypothetical protein
MTESTVITKLRQKLGIRRALRKWLITLTLPPDAHFNEAWRVYQYSLRQCNDARNSMTILRDLPNLGPDIMTKAEAEYRVTMEALSFAIQTLLRINCQHPENIRRKLELAIEENVNASDVASILTDLEALKGWIGMAGSP